MYNGERDYTKISSHLGPCFYPAGHLFHYIPVFWLHLQTPLAEKIVQFGYILIHSLTIVYATKIAYLYHGKQGQIKAQILGIILLANQFDRSDQYRLMFNDELMMLYMLIGLYALFQNRPVSSICWITLALSVKAGVMLVLPALLGSI